MAKTFEILNLLCPNVEWTMYGDQYEGIIWHDGKPAITKEEFDEWMAKFDSWKAKQDSDKVKAKAALLERLGITEDEARLLIA
jgi:glycogen debranching enzyme